MQFFRCGISLSVLILGPLNLEKKTNQDFHDDDALQSFATTLASRYLAPFARWNLTYATPVLEGANFAWGKRFGRRVGYTLKNSHGSKKNGTEGLVPRIFLFNWVFFG